MERAAATEADPGDGHPSWHSVRFFEGGDYPALRIADWLGASLDAGGGAFLFARPAHEAMVARALDRRGVDVAKLTALGRLRLTNAVTAASAIVQNSRPDPAAFEAIIGEPVREAIRRYGSVRAYGELVDVLARKADFEGALALEGLWNGLLAESNAELLCGYALGSFQGAGSVEVFSRICEEHTLVEPASEEPVEHVPRLLAELEQRTVALEHETSLRLETERERDVLLERAEAASRAKDEFLAMLGHELRNPLSPILTAVELMRVRAEGALVKERSIIERQVNHMVRLVDDLLDVSRITRGKVELKMAPVEVARVVSDAIEMASPLLEERSHRLVKSVPASGLLVNADCGRLAQVVSNLLTNAAKYTPPGGVITIDARKTGGSMELSVHDDGVGIEPSLLPHVFDLFVQGRQAIDRPHGGLGLGLSIAKNLIEMHGGSLRVQSDGIGRGCVFTLGLELLSKAKDESSPRSAPVLRTRVARKVLVVDDNRDAADSFAEFLQTAGHRTYVTYDGLSALAAAMEFRPDVAVLDLGLPVMDGHELARRMVKLLPDNPPILVAITGYGDQMDRRRSRESGFHRHLLKPVDPGELRDLIENLYAKPRLDSVAGA